MSNTSKFKEALFDYHKRERGRAELCLSDILTLLTDGGAPMDQVDAIIDRMIRYYERSGEA